MAMTLAHVGLAVTLAGIAASAWQQERIEIMKPGDDVPIAGYTLRLDAVDKVQGPNFTAERADVTVRKGGSVVAEMHPEKRFFPLQQMSTGVTAIKTNLLADLYVALGDSDGKGGWTVRAWWKPLVPWIWIGAVMMALGGVVSLSDRRLRLGVAARAPRPPAAPGRRSRRCGARSICCRSLLVAVLFLLFRSGAPRGLRPACGALAARRSADASLRSRRA